MSVLLAIEPDRRQAAKLTALARGQLQVEIVVGETAEEAFQALGARVPDLVLTSLLLSPKDESALADRLRELDAAGRHVQTVVIPVLGTSSEADGKRSKGFFGRLLRSNAKPTTDGCDPALFGDQIREYLERAAAERAANAAAQADLDAAWSVKPPPADDVGQLFAAPPQPVDHEPTKDEAVLPSWESTSTEASSWESSSGAVSSWESTSGSTASWESTSEATSSSESTSASTSSWESTSAATDDTPVVAFESGSVGVEIGSNAGDRNVGNETPDLAEELRAHLSSVVEPEVPIESPQAPVEAELPLVAPVAAAETTLSSPWPEHDFSTPEPTPAVTARESGHEVELPADPFVEAAPSTLFASTPAPAEPEVQEEEWEEISLDVAGEQEAPSEIVSEVIDLEALMRELHAVESEGEDELPQAHGHSRPPSIVANVAEKAPGPALSASDLEVPAPPVTPPVVSTPDPAPAPRPTLDLEAFAAELKLAATPVVPEPVPEPPPPPRPSAFQSGWRDVLSAIRRDIDQLRDEKPAPPPVQDRRDRSFEPLVFPVRPAPAAEALSRIEPPAPARVEPPPAPVAPRVLAQLEEAVQSVLKPLVKKSREAAAPPPALETSVPTPEPPTPAITVAPVVTITAPVIAELTTPVIAEVTKPDLAEVTPPVVAAVTAPVVAEVTRPAVAEVAPPVVLEIAPPVIAEAPPVREITPPVELTAASLTQISPPVIAPPSSLDVHATPIEPISPPAAIEKAVTPPAATVPVPALEVAPVVERPAPKPIPSPLELLSSLGLEPVDVLVPDQALSAGPEPVNESPAEMSSPETESDDPDAVLVEPPAHRTSKSKKKRRQEQAKPAAKPPQIDDWGFFDPQKIDLATLLSKLNEVAGLDEQGTQRR